jgi:hypothetical protein
MPTIVGLALYAAVLISSPFEHHDLICHLKTPQHCMSCASSQLGSATIFEPLAEGALLAAASTGRSPPAAL